MANQIKMAVRDSIYGLYDRGWSQRRIARTLDVDRETVCRHLRLRAAEAAKPAIVPAGTEEGGAAKPAISPTGDDPPKPAIVPAGTVGRASACRAHDAIIRQGIETGLTAQRIFQDLRTDHGFTGSYDSVKRYVRRLTAGHADRVQRMECAPGEEAQVDFGLGAPILVDGRKRRSWVFRMVLSHSRKAYSEAVYRQGTEEFIRAMENAFRAFGGAPKTLVIDNLRAAVTRADWYEPELTPKVVEFCRHYGTVILPTRPRHPEHKGKVERGVGYVKSNALKGRVFNSLAEENAYLRRWEEHVADQRIHGTTRQHVGRCFAERERGALQPLPPMPFPCFEEGQRCVHRDAHVEVRHAYYEVPEEYIGRQVWVRIDGRLVRVFNLRMEPLVTHARLEPGQFSPAQTDSRGRRHGVERTAEYWCGRAEQLGPWCGEWAQRVRVERGVQSIRVLMGLMQLAKRAGRRALDQVCAQAVAHGAWRLRELRRLLEHGVRSEQLSFLERHPLIRDLEEYGKVVGAFETGPTGQRPELPTAASAGCEGPFGASMDNSSLARAMQS
jgi:transposase